MRKSFLEKMDFFMKQDVTHHLEEILKKDIYQIDAKYHVNVTYI